MEPSSLAEPAVRVPRGRGRRGRAGHFSHEEPPMKKILFAAVAVCGLTLSGVALRAADEKEADKGKSFHGVLIDNACGANKKTEADAAKHTIACAKKSSCEESGYQL